MRDPCTLKDAFKTDDSFLVGLLRSRSTTRLLVKRLSILHAALNELRPIRHYGNGIGLFREESPERRMVPAEFMPGAVTMLTDTSSQHPHLINELLTRHLSRSGSMMLLRKPVKTFSSKPFASEPWGLECDFEGAVHRPVPMHRSDLTVLVVFS